MKLFFNRFFKVFAVTLFFVAVLVNVISIILLPEYLATNLLSNIHRIGEVNTLLYPFFGVSISLIVISTTLTLYYVFIKSKKINTEVVYVDRVIEGGKETATKIKRDEEKEELRKLEERWSQLLEDDCTTDMALQAICDSLEAGQGILYGRQSPEGTHFEMIASYAFTDLEGVRPNFELGEDTVGQVAKNKKVLVINQIPENQSLIRSGLGEALPKTIVIFPILDAQKEVVGVLEIGSFKAFNEKLVSAIEQRLESFAGFCQLTQP